MSTVEEFLAEVDKEEELRCLEDEKYFKEQDEKFQELYRKITELKDQNKKHMDTIINNLDDLVASKKLIQETLEEVGNVQGLDISLPVESINLSVVELLSTVTGFVSDTEELIKPNIGTVVEEIKNEECDAYETESEKGTDEKCDTEVRNDKIKNECVIKTEVEDIKKSDTEITEEKCKAEDLPSLQESTKLLEDLCINSSNTPVPGDSKPV